MLQSNCYSGRKLLRKPILIPKPGRHVLDVISHHRPPASVWLAGSGAPCHSCKSARSPHKNSSNNGVYHDRVRADGPGPHHQRAPRRSGHRPGALGSETAARLVTRDMMTMAAPNDGSMTPPSGWDAGAGVPRVLHGPGCRQQQDVQRRRDVGRSPRQRPARGRSPLEGGHTGQGVPQPYPDEKCAHHHIATCKNYRFRCLCGPDHC